MARVVGFDYRRKCGTKFGRTIKMGSARGLTSAKKGFAPDG